MIHLAPIGLTDYYIDQSTQIYSFKSGKMIRKKTSISRRGYEVIGCIRNGKKTLFYVHRIIAWAFVPGYDQSLSVNHKNGIKTDNRIENLEWCTHKENMLHAKKEGLIKNNINKNRKLDDVEVLTILTCNNVESRILSEIYKISKSSVIKIRKNQSYKNVIQRNECFYVKSKKK